MELWINEVWLLGTAIVFTYVGWRWGQNSMAHSATEQIIDGLIEQGFLKTEGVGKDMEIVPWREWCDDKTSG